MVNSSIGNVDMVTDNAEYKVEDMSAGEGGLHDVSLSLVQWSRGPKAAQVEARLIGKTTRGKG